MKKTKLKSIKAKAPAKSKAKPKGATKTKAKKTSAKGPKVGASVPAFETLSTAAEGFNSKGISGRNLVLYFYPKDATPGCTLEGQDFTRLYPQFQKSKTDVVGVSRDNVKSHEKFRAKMGFPFHLASDEDEKLCKLFGVVKMKNMYGRQVWGIERSTFVIDSKGVLRREWRGVKVTGHAEEVLDYVKNLE
jgi:thioredoxin-dependent peroxiredoxin